MSFFVDKIKKLECFYETGGVSIKEVEEAERLLELSFSEEYKEYLFCCGRASFDGHEITGLGMFKRLNVVEATNRERERHAYVPKNWYVIEDLGIDRIVIWQTSTGEIYQSIPELLPKKVCDSLLEYIKNK